MKRLAIIFSFIFSIPFLTEAQHQHNEPEEKESPAKEIAHSQHHMESNAASAFFMNEAAGTSVNPPAAPMHMGMMKKGKWNLMTHGYVFVNAIEQSGPRGKDQVFSANHLMLMAERPLSVRSSFMFRTMLSLEPATITGRYYPLLFQTGETAFGEPIIDGQHPHDFFMELSFQYALTLSKDSLVHFYFAPVGDPALGPVAFPHRASAEELPPATLSHHLQDSTHIANDVITAGFQYKIARIEFSGFHGGEPDEGRWDIDQGAIDSWSTRLTITPHENWTAQVSTGKLKKPEALEPGDITRTTASVSFAQSLNGGQFLGSLIWGQNKKSFNDSTTHSFGAEALYRKAKNNFTGRIEIVDKDELSGQHVEERTQDVFPDGTFRINAFTVGYSRDFSILPKWQTGLGATMTLYSFPAALNPFYGSSPKAFLFYFRIRPGH